MTLNKNIKLIFASSVLFLLSSIDLVAAGPPGPPGGGGPPGGCWPPSACIPLDGGLGFLLAAGVAYGGKMLYNHKKNAE